MGHTEPGLPYQAQGNDENGNNLSRDITHPEIISKYFTRDRIGSNAEVRKVLVGTLWLVSYP